MRSRVVSIVLFVLMGVLVCVFVVMATVLSGLGDYILDSWESRAAREREGEYNNFSSSPLEKVEESEEEGEEVSLRGVSRGLLRGGGNWRERGRRYRVEEGVKGLIVLVIDDVGERLREGLKAVRLEGPLTVSILPYGRYAERLAEEASERGHDVFVHLPMEPEGKEKRKVGRMALLRDMSDDDITARTLWNLTRFDNVVGVNNHMGSRFTRWEHGMGIFFQELALHDLLFLDSMTHPRSRGWRVARERGIPYAVRDIFIDHDPEVRKIRVQLQEVKSLALKRGYAVAIGHPYGETLSLLGGWMKAMREEGYMFVPLTTLMVHLEERG